MEISDNDPEEDLCTEDIEVVAIEEDIAVSWRNFIDVFQNPGTYLRNPKMVIALAREAVLALGIGGLLTYNLGKAALAGTVGFEMAESVLNSTFGIEIPIENELMARILVAGLTTATSSSFYVALGMIAVRLGIKDALEEK